MSHSNDQRFRAVATRFAQRAIVFGGVVSSFGLIGSSGAAWAQQPAAPVPAAAATAKRLPIDHVEQRLAQLHAKLKITAAQEPQWSAFADASRTDAKTMSDLLTQRSQQATTMTAVDDMKSYSQLTDAHADGVRKLVPVFQALYDTMSPEQKENADVVFGKMQAHHTPHPHAKKAKP